MRNKNEQLQRFSHTEVSIVRSAVCRAACRGRFRGRGFVELADAGALRIESDRLLASRRTDHTEHDPVRRIPWRRRAKRASAFWRQRALETEDAGAAGTIPPKPS